MTQTIVLCRLVGTIDVTFNQMAATEVDGRQLRQGLEALQVACSRRARVRGFQNGQLSQNVQFVALRQQHYNDPNHCAVSTRGNG